MPTSENDFTRRSINTERTKKDEKIRRMGEVRNVKFYIRKKVGNKERKREAKKVFQNVLTVERKSNEKYRQGNLPSFFPTCLLQRSVRYRSFIL
jgi:hypothetical protein